MEHFGIYVGGKFRLPALGRTLLSVDPTTGQPWAEIARGDDRDVDAAVRAAHAAFTDGPWAAMSPTARGLALHRLGDLALDHLEELVRAESRDNGKSHTELRVALRTMAGWYHYYGGLADKVQGEVLPVDRPDVLAYTRLEPYGVVAAILPWNSPLRLAAWKVAPALAAGNTVVVKPSEHTSTSILRFVELVEQAGIPPGVVNVVTGYGPEVVPALVAHPLVARVSFTGGAAAGAVVAELTARHIKPVTLELGGKSAQVVFADADLDRAANGIAGGVFASGGQTCLAGSRAIVHADVLDALVERVAAIAGRVRVGDPGDATTDVGPIATADQFARILEHIDRARRSGATLVTGGGPVGGDGGSFIAPTIFTAVTPDMAIFQEEVFGPVLTFTPFTTEAEAVRLANDVVYGLAAGVWTRDLARAHRVAGRIDAGSVWINSYRNTVPQAPFGGYKRSGLGRESGTEAIREYLQTKTVWVDLAEGYPRPFG